MPGARYYRNRFDPVILAPHSRIVLIAGVLACGPSPPGDTSTTAATTDPVDSTDPVGSTGPIGSTGPTPTGTSPMTTTGSTDGTTSCEPDDPPTCEPLPLPQLLEFRLDGKGPGDEDNQDYQQPCTVVAASLAAIELAIDVACVDAMGLPAMHEIRVRVDPPLPAAPLTAGDIVTLRVLTEVFLESNTRHIVIVGPGEQLALAYVEAPWLPPPAFLAPLAVAPVAVCPPACDEAACGFIVSECPCEERRALDFTIADQTLRVVDGNFADAAGAWHHALRVARASCREAARGSTNFCGWCSYHLFVARTP